MPRHAAAPVRYRQGQKNQNTKNMKEKTFLVRTYFRDETSFIDYFFQHDQIAILVDQEDEFKVWDKYVKENGSTEKKQFVDRWFNLQKSINENDVLILATYRDKSFAKIGKIKKGTQFTDFTKDPHYKIFQLEKKSVKTFELSDFPIFSSIIPSNVTISPIKKRAEVIRHIYHYDNLNNLSIELGNISEKLVELICIEWLRSDLAGENKIKYQLLLTGGNFANIDILGTTIKDKRLAAQVSDTNDKKTIELKINKLKNFKSDIKFLFCKDYINKESGITIIPLQKVWDDLMNNGYKKMLETLVRQ